MADIKPKWRRGLDASLGATDIANGNILLAKDTGRLFIDIDDERVEITDFVKSTEAEILAILTPLPKFYFATDTGKIYYYSNGWQIVNEPVVVNEAAPTVKAYITATPLDEEVHVSTQVFDPKVYLGEVEGQLVAEEFIGDLTGNADTATKATQDGDGNVITDTYETKTDASAKYEESIIGLSIDGQTITYIKGDGSTHTIITQDTDTTYSLATDETTGLTRLYATTGSAEDGTMTQKAITTELNKKVSVSVDDSNNTLVFTI